MSRYDKLIHDARTQEPSREEALAMAMDLIEKAAKRGCDCICLSKTHWSIPAYRDVAFWQSFPELNESQGVYVTKNAQGQICFVFGTEGIASCKHAELLEAWHNFAQFAQGCAIL
jgi:hypothetical protein